MFPDPGSDLSLSLFCFVALSEGAAQSDGATTNPAPIRPVRPTKLRRLTVPRSWPSDPVDCLILFTKIPFETFYLARRLFDVVVCEGCREITVRIDLGFELGNLLLCAGDGVRSG